MQKVLDFVKVLVLPTIFFGLILPRFQLLSGVPQDPVIHWTWAVLFAAVLGTITERLAEEGNWVSGALLLVFPGLLILAAEWLGTGYSVNNGQDVVAAGLLLRLVQSVIGKMQ